MHNGGNNVLVGSSLEMYEPQRSHLCCLNRLNTSHLLGQGVASSQHLTKGGDIRKSNHDSLGSHATEYAHLQRDILCYQLYRGNARSELRVCRPGSQASTMITVVHPVECKTASASQVGIDYQGLAVISPFLLR